MDHYANETVNYTYDELNRLSNAAAVGGAWSQSYTYDGFGNLTDKSAAGAYPAMHVTFDPATNWQTGVQYDANGNPTANGTYDVENRLTASGAYQYDYQGKRVKKAMGGTTEVYFYGSEADDALVPGNGVRESGVQRVLQREVGEEQGRRGGDRSPRERAEEREWGDVLLLSVRRRADQHSGQSGEVRDVHAGQSGAGLCGSAVLRAEGRGDFSRPIRARENRRIG